MINTQNNIRNIEIDKSVNKLISTQKKNYAMKLSDIDANNQYIMVSKYELSRLRKLEYHDISYDELNSMVSKKLSDNREIEMEKSINILIAKRKQVSFNDMNDFNQYRLALNLEVTKLRKNGYLDVTTNMLDKMVDNRIKLEQIVDKTIESMEQQPSITNYNRQKGYTVIGILGLITCIATIGIIFYGYILFYR